MLFLYLVAAYLIGSISSAILVCRLLGEPDPRTGGSGNPGATNVLRQSGKLAAALTLAGDVFKGFLPVFVGVQLGFAPTAIAVLGLGAFFGHLFPVFFGFRGGKGVATLIGVLFGLTIWSGFAFIGSWLLVAVLFRYSSLAALLAAAAAPVAAWYFNLAPVIVGAIAFMVVALYWRHLSNIKKLLAGNEAKIGRKSAD